MIVLLACLVHLVVLLLGCSRGEDVSGNGEVVVFAASSLTEVFQEIGADFEKQNPGIHVVFNFAGSSTLRAQLVEGAQAEVFASADMRQMELARESLVVTGEPQVFATNRLVVVAYSRGPVKTLQDLALPGVRMVLALEEVPAGVYAQEVLRRLSQDPLYGTEYYVAVSSSVVSLESNVRLAMAKVLLGEADAGMVYDTDAKAADSEALRVIPIHDPFSPVARYPVALMRYARRPDLAQAFVDFLLSPAAQATLERYGFGPSEGT